MLSTLPLLRYLLRSTTVANTLAALPKSFTHCCVYSDRKLDRPSRETAFLHLTKHQRWKKYVLATVYGGVVFLHAIILWVCVFYPDALQAATTTSALWLGNTGGATSFFSGQHTYDNAPQLWSQATEIPFNYYLNAVITSVALIIPVSFAFVMIQAATLLRTFVWKTVGPAAALH